MKSFKKHLESYGMGGVSIGSLDSYRPMASLGSTDRPPQPSADQRATTAVKPQTKVKKKKMDKISKPIKDYLKKKKTKN